jgi:hypothetical protein
MNTFDALKDQVAKIQTIEGSVVYLLAGIAEQLTALNIDRSPVKYRGAALSTFISELKSAEVEMSLAVIENANTKMKTIAQPVMAAPAPAVPVVLDEAPAKHTNGKKPAKHTNGKSHRSHARA